MEDIARELLEIQTELDQRRKYNFIDSIFPDNDIPDEYEQTGFIHARSKYKKHIEFMDAGSKYHERAFIAANRVGKSLAGVYEVCCHATGMYPHWWKGKRFNKPVTIWLCGDRGEAVRDGIQKALMERSNRYKGEDGTGLLRRDCLDGQPRGMSNVPGAYGLYSVKHISGGFSSITIKTYQAGRTAFESAAVDVIMLDEECPREIYSECILRTLTTGGTVFLTFTPDSGLTDTVLAFFEDGDFKNGAAKNKFVTMVGWDDVPHIAQIEKEKALAAMMPHEIDCRTKGMPYLGAGVIYPIPVEDVVVEPFKIPEHWSHCFGMDVGWNRTAVVWFAVDQDTRVKYIYSEYYVGEKEPASHAHGIRSRGDWIPGFIDPAARGRGNTDGQQLLQMYLDLGLDLTKADNSVESGIYTVFQQLQSGLLKVFSTCNAWVREYRLYRRDDKGHIVKKNDHLMDAMRYGIMTGIDLAVPPPIEYEPSTTQKHVNSTICGY